MVAAWLLGLIILAGFFAPFLSPYDPTIAGRDKEYLNGAPQIPMFCDKNGCSWAPFLHGTEMKLDTKTLRRKPVVNEDQRLYVRFLTEGWEYSFIDWNLDLPGDSFDTRIKALTFTTHLFGHGRGPDPPLRHGRRGQGRLRPHACMRSGRRWRSARWAC